MPNNPPPRNPHAHAAGAYASQAKEVTASPRELEARALLKAVQKMQDLQSRWGHFGLEEIDDVLRHNRQIWMLFVDHAISEEGAANPPQLRNNITNLGAYVFKRTLDILAQPEKDKLNVLIDINREIAAGLMAAPKAEG